MLPAIVLLVFSDLACVYYFGFQVLRGYFLYTPTSIASQKFTPLETKVLQRPYGGRGNANKATAEPYSIQKRS
jgi:hypothetical protein